MVATIVMIKCVVIEKARLNRPQPIVHDFPRDAKPPPRTVTSLQARRTSLKALRFSL
jgi:hypothetical protein